MRYLAIDYGLKRVGLAICDAQEIIVSPLCQLEMPKKGATALISQIEQTITKNPVDGVVVGLPYNMDGSEGPQAQRTRQFAVALARSITLPIYLFDERLSSAAADEMLQIGEFTNKKHKQRRDMIAACVILRDFLDHNSTNPIAPLDPNPTSKES
ncbi:MAG: Holliday junction resolvase RuvX [Sedimentisphaerales bacterium]|nr:Holliday junction resolvase RuvX [Sedimentisphaerales bacterium]